MAALEDGVDVGVPPPGAPQPDAAAFHVVMIGLGADSQSNYSASAVVYSGDIH